MNEQENVYARWDDLLTKSDIRKIINSVKLADVHISSEKMIAYKEFLENARLIDFVAFSERFNYEKGFNKVRKTIYDKISEDLNSDIPFILKMMGCLGLEYLDEKILSKDDFLTINKDFKNGAENIISLFEINGRQIDLKKWKFYKESFFDDFILSMNEFLVNKNIKDYKEKSFLIELLNSSKIEKKDIFFSPVLKLLDKRNFNDKFEQERINDILSKKIQTMSQKELNMTILAIGIKVNHNISFKQGRDTEEVGLNFDKSFALKVLKRLNYLITLNKSGCDNNLVYHMSSIHHMTNISDELNFLNKNLLNETVIIQEKNKNGVKMIINDVLLSAAIQMSVQKHNYENKNANQLASRKINELFEAILTLYNKDKYFKQDYCIENLYIQKANDYKISQLIIKLDKSCEDKNIEKIKSFLVDSLYYGLSFLDENRDLEMLKSDIELIYEKTILMNENDNLKTECDIKPRKKLKKF